MIVNDAFRGSALGGAEFVPGGRSDVEIAQWPYVHLVNKLRVEPLDRLGAILCPPPTPPSPLPPPFPPHHSPHSPPFLW